MPILRAVKWEQFLLLLGVVEYIFMFPHGIHGDASVRYDSLLQSLQAGKLVPMVYSYVHPLVSSPLLLLGHIFKDGFWWICRFNVFCFLGLLFFVWKTEARWKERGAEPMILAFLFMGATMFPKHVTDYYAEVFCACLAFASILLFLSGRSVLAIVFVCLSVWNAIATFAGGTLLLIFFALRSKRWRYLAAIPLLPLGFLAENFIKYGHASPTAYLAMTIPEGTRSLMPYSLGPGFSYPLFFGLLNIFLSFGRGLLFFAPGLLMFFHPSLWKGKEKSKEVLRAGAVYLLGLVLLYAKYWCWHAGAFWGPRYFLFASLLAAYALAVIAREKDLSTGWRVLWAGCVALSAWVACQGVFFGTDFLENCFSQGHELEFICLYVPEYSVLWRTFIVGPPLVGRRMAFLAYFLLVAVTLLWAPLRELLGEAKAALRGLWKANGPGAGWRA